MRILCFGSLNIDYTYMLDHFVEKGETISSYQKQNFSGGKGLNQSIALAKAGAEVFHAGAVGVDGEFLLEEMRQAGVNVSMVQVLKEISTGHAIIQIDKSGDNCIILYGGANQEITEEYIDSVLDKFDAGDMLVLQNEINNLPYIVEHARKKGMKIVLNPSPLDKKIFELPLEHISLFVLNEVEASQLIGKNGIKGEELIKELKNKFNTTEIILTLGDKGSIYDGNLGHFFQKAQKVEVVDTTAAGDTFLGYVLAGLASGLDISDAMKRATVAASIAIGRKGASPSIPYYEEVDEKLERR